MKYAEENYTVFCIIRYYLMILVNDKIIYFLLRL